MRTNYWTLNQSCSPTTFPKGIDKIPHEHSQKDQNKLNAHVREARPAYQNMLSANCGYSKRREVHQSKRKSSNIETVIIMRHEIKMLLTCCSCCFMYNCSQLHGLQRSARY